MASALAIAAVAAHAADPPPSVPAAMLMFASGPASVTSKSGRSALLLKGGPVRPGDVIRTGAGTRAQLRFGDGSYLSLFPGTDLKLDAYRFGDVPKASELALFTLYRGGARFQTGSIGRSPGSTFRVSTAVAAVDGAACEFVAIAGDRLQVRVGAGRITIRNKAGVLTVNAGQRALVATPDSPPYLIGTLVPERIAP